MKRALIAVSIVGVVSCATTSGTEATNYEPKMLSQESFEELWNAAYNSNPESDSEIAFAALLKRGDLSPSQRGIAYMGRGLIRGIFVRDWPEAYPQCALADFMKAKDFPLPDARSAQLRENVQYQLSRQQYFDDAPRFCKEYAAEAAVWVNAKDGKDD